MSAALTQLEGSGTDGPTIVRLGKLLDSVGFLLPNDGQFKTAVGPVVAFGPTACKAALRALAHVVSLLKLSFPDDASQPAKRLPESFMANWAESKMKFSGAFRFDIRSEIEAVEAIGREIVAAKRLAAWDSGGRSRLLIRNSKQRSARAPY